MSAPPLHSHLSTALNFELFSYLCCTASVFLKGETLSFPSFIWQGLFWMSAASNRDGVYYLEVLVKVIKQLLLLHLTPVSQHSLVIVASFVPVSFSNNNH